jgi:hypothetical protein
MCVCVCVCVCVCWEWNPGLHTLGKSSTKPHPSPSLTFQGWNVLLLFLASTSKGPQRVQRASLVSRTAVSDRWGSVSRERLESHE